MKFNSLLRKETRIILRSPLLLLVLILYPLVIVGILGYAFSEPNQAIPLAVLNQDLDASGNVNVARVRSPLDDSTSGVTVSSEYIMENLTLGGFAQLVPVRSMEAGRQLLLTGQVQAVVRFPLNFAKDIAELSTNGVIDIIIDDSDPIRANYTEIIIRGVVQEFQEQIVHEKVTLVINAINHAVPEIFVEEDSLYPGFEGVRNRLLNIRATVNLSDEQEAKVTDAIEFIDAVLEVLDNSKNIVRSVSEPVRVSILGERSGVLFVRDLIVPAALGLGIFWSGTVATASLVVYDRESAAYERLRITPISASSIYGSKIFLTLLIVLAQSLLILLPAILFWRTHVDNVLLTFLVVLLSSAAAIGLGIFLAGLSRDVTGSVLLSVLITFPMMLLGGLFFPVSFMPEGAQRLADAFPLTHTVAALRGAMLRGFSFADAGVQLVSLTAFAVLSTVFGVLLGKWQERRR